MKYTVGELCETLDSLRFYEDKFENWSDNDKLSFDDTETLAAILSDYQKLLLNIEIDI